MDFPVNRLAAVWWQTGRYALYATGHDGNTYQKWHAPAKGWSGWESLGRPHGVPAAGPVGAVMREKDVYYVGVVGEDAKMYSNVWRGNRWDGWNGGADTPTRQIPASLAMVSWKWLRLGSYAVGGDGHLYENWQAPGVDAKYNDLGRPDSSPLGGPVAAVSWTSGRYGVYCVGRDGNLYQKWWGAMSWSGWENLDSPRGVNLIGVAAVSWRLNRYGVYAIGNDGNLYQRWWASSWSGWESLGRPAESALEGSIAAVSWAAGRYGVYAFGTDGELYGRTCHNTWDGWQRIAGAPVETEAEAVV